MLAWLLALLGATIAAPAMAACSAPTTLTDTVGDYSAPAVKAGAMGYVAVPGGFTCPANVLTLLSNNYLRATVTSINPLKLTPAVSGNTDTITYTLAAAASGAPALSLNTQTYFINGTAVNLLGLLGGTMNVPIYVKLGSTSTLAPGTYTGTATVKWEWHFCPSIDLLGGCLLAAADDGTVNTVITFKVTVSAKPATVTIASLITWDPVSGTNSPKMIPGAKRRVTMTVANPDLVPLDLNKLNVTLPTPAGTVIALDGDGTGQGQVIQFTPNASTLLFNYTSPSDLGDDVDFSTNGGASYIAVPTPGDAASQASVNSVLFHPRGAMAAGSSFSVSLPYSVR